MAQVQLLLRERDLSAEEFFALARTLPAPQQERLAHIRHPGQAQASLLGLLLARRLLHSQFDLPENDLLFTTNGHGKPALAAYPDCHFNISHSGRVVACGVDVIPIGLDVEEVRPVNLQIARRFFTPDEQEFIFSQPKADQPAAFFSVWTKKESYIKWVGRGLGIPLTSFDVLAPPVGVVFHPLWVDTTEAAIGHVCSSSSSPPVCTTHSLGNFLAQL